ncbi:MAG: hypothetical protein AB4040_10775 [Synechococcus sp.]
MYTVLFTYGLNPLKGLKLMVRSQQKGLWKQVLKQGRKANLSVGALVPEDSKSMSMLELVAKLKFFVALEGEEPDPEQKLLPGSTSVGLQVYEHGDGDTKYKAEVMRWKLGKSRTRSRRYR